jgi:hypothetical protein
VSATGEVNGWACEDCGQTTYCIHVDDGVTPFYLGCRATEGCEGMAKSMFYPSGPVPDYALDKLAFEWYMPDAEERAGLKPEVREHVEKGGLLLRELTDAGREQIKVHLG